MPALRPQPLIPRVLLPALLLAGSVACSSDSVTGVYTGSTPMERDTAGRVTSTRDPFVRLDLRLAPALPRGLELTLGVDNVFDDRPARWAGRSGASSTPA